MFDEVTPNTYSDIILISHIKRGMDGKTWYLVVMLCSPSRVRNELDLDTLTSWYRDTFCHAWGGGRPSNPSNPMHRKMAGALAMAYAQNTGKTSQFP